MTTVTPFVELAGDTITLGPEVPGPVPRIGLRRPRNAEYTFHVADGGLIQRAGWLFPDGLKVYVPWTERDRMMNNGLPTGLHLTLVWT